MNENAIPWNDQAVLIHTSDAGKRSIRAEGSLKEVVRRIEAIATYDWHCFAISLPDRGAAPFEYAHDAFLALIQTRPA